jgi:flagellar hook assembly protein FlgD
LEYNNRINPLRGDCASVEVRVASSGRIKIDLYTLLGQKVLTLADESATIGDYNYRWCARNQSGGLVSSGAYLMHVESPQQKKDYQIIVVK